MKSQSGSTTNLLLVRVLLEVFVNGGKVKSVAESLDLNGYDISFTPTSDIPHEVSVRFNNEPVIGTPFVCNIIDPQNINIFGPSTETSVKIHRPTYFTVSTGSTYPHGVNISQELMDITINEPSGTELPTKLVEDSESGIQVHFTPESVGSHKVHLRYAGAKAMDPVTIRCFDSSRIKLSPIDGNGLHQEAQFDIDVAKAGAGNMEIVVAAEDANVPNHVKGIGDNVFRVFFTPTTPVRHAISVHFNGELVPGCPMYYDLGQSSEIIAEQQRLVGKQETQPTRRSDDTDTSPTKQTKSAKNARSLVASKITVSGDGLDRAPVNKTTEFVLYTAGATSQDCNVIVTSPDGDAVPVRCYQLKDGNFKVQYEPTTTGTHKIDVSFADEPIPHSPFYVEVYDPKGVQIETVRDAITNRKIAAKVDLHGADANQLNVTVTDPKKKNVPTSVIEQSGRGAVIQFIPVIAGKHTLNATIAGKPVEGTPMTFIVKDTGVTGAPAAFGTGLERGIVGQSSEFTVDARQLKGDIKLTIQSPNNTRPSPNVVKRGDGIFDITFVPVEPGKHTVKILWNEKVVNGSPFHPHVIDPSQCRIMTPKTDAKGKKIQQGEFPLVVDQMAKLEVDIKDAGYTDKDAKDLAITADVRGPDNRKLPVDVSYKQCANLPVVMFTPRQEGEHNIRLFYHGHPIPRTPLMSTAKTVTRVSGGYGGAVAQVTGEHTDSHSETESDEEKDVDEKRMNGHIEDSETIEYHSEKLSRSGHSASRETFIRDPMHIVLRGQGLREAKVNTETEFIVDGSEADPGRPNVELQGHRADIPVKLLHLGNNVYRGTYTPATAGSYDLHIRWNDNSLAGSPFKVNAITVGDANKVTVSGDGVKSGIVGEDVKSLIDVRKAGPGKLNAHCVGPSKKKVYCELDDHKDGTFTLNIKPEEVGKHILVIKFGDMHVTGSPYSLFISSPPDPSKVKVSGPGVEPGILSRFKSEFLVDTKGAGAGQLTVRVRGPKGAFNVEMTRDSRQDRVILCSYDPKEPGDYQIEVRWAGEPVPGSPFTVMIFDTESELDRYKSGTLPLVAQTPPYGFPPGWVGPPPPGINFGPPRPRAIMGPPGPPGHPPPPGSPQMMQRQPMLALPAPPGQTQLGPPGPGGPPRPGPPPPHIMMQQQQFQGGHPQDPPAGGGKYATLAGYHPRAGPPPGTLMRGPPPPPHMQPGPPGGFPPGGPRGPPRFGGPPNQGPPQRFGGPPHPGMGPQPSPNAPYSSATLPHMHRPPHPSQQRPRMIVAPGNM